MDQGGLAENGQIAALIAGHVIEQRGCAAFAPINGVELVHRDTGC